MSIKIFCHTIKMIVSDVQTADY